MPHKRGVAIVSGGLDSVTLAYDLVSKDYEIEVMTFDYGQRHKKEIEFARKCAEDLSAKQHIVNLQTVSTLFGKSSLTSKETLVPDGHYAEESMRVTVVPNRNAIMINIATALAVSKGFDFVATGVHGGDHFIYPDCRPDFISKQSDVLRVANSGFITTDFDILAPYVRISKAEIVKIGQRLGVPWAETWSCYKGDDVHCGSCGTCFERREAFLIANIDDPTRYTTTPTFLDPR